jgi:hypothetical protein
LNQAVKKVKSSNFFTIGLDGAVPRDLPISEFPLNENHFFCTALDLAMPFPYARTAGRDPGFDWNCRWMVPFEGCPAACVILLQGAAFSLSVGDTERNLTYLIRRSSQNAGTRYAARGLDGRGDPANECECDLLFCVKKETVCKTWRRGSPPIKWQTVLPSSLSTPRHCVAENATELTASYFGRIFRRFSISGLRIVSLLNERAEKGETELLQGLERGVREIKGFDIEFHQADINRMISESGAEGAMHRMMQILGEVNAGVGFSSEAASQPAMIRFNCADSLDRTNLVTFYYAMTVCAEFGGDFVANSAEGPVRGLCPDVLEFLANAFIETGNIVSMLYTNTPAIKTGQIRALIPSLPDQASDTAITIIRRYHNVTTDRQRQILFTQWTDLTRTNHMFWMDPTHLSLAGFIRGVAKQFVSLAIFDADELLFHFDQAIDPFIVVTLPEAFLLSKIAILVFPRATESLPTVTISCGVSGASLYPFAVDLPIPRVSAPHWCEFNLRKLTKTSLQLPISGRALAPCIFVGIRFNAHSPFTIGNIRIGVKRPQQKLKAFVPTVVKEEAMREFERALIGDDHSLQSLVKIERTRVLQGISELMRNKVVIGHLMNPFSFDIGCRLLPKAEGVCAFCMKPGPSRIEVGCFEPLPVFFRRFNECEEPLCRVSLCDDCAAQLEHVDPSDLAPKFEIIDESRCVAKTMLDGFQEPIDLSLFSTIFNFTGSAPDISIQDILNPPFSFPGWAPTDRVADLTVSFPSSCDVSQIVVLFGDSPTPAIDIFTERREAVRTKECGRIGRAVIYDADFMGLDPTRFVIVHFEGAECFVVKKLEIRGRPRKFAERRMRVVQKEVFAMPAVKESNALFDFVNRVQIFNFEAGRRMQGVIITVRSGTTYPQSIVVVLCLRHEIADWQSLILPKIKSGGKIELFYEVYMTEVVFDEVRVLYLDKVHEIVPLSISFV